MMHTSQIIMLYILSLYTTLSQLYFLKMKGKQTKQALYVWFPYFQFVL